MHDPTMPAAPLTPPDAPRSALLYVESSSPTHLTPATPATPIVLLHAAVVDSGMWDGVFERLAAARPTVRYDLRGYGRSPDPEGPFSHHDDLLALLDRLGIAHAHLVGCSNGGAVALDAALVAPARVASLTLVSSALGGHDFEGPPPPTLLALFSALAEGDGERATELAMRVWADGPRRDPDRLPSELRERIGRMAGPALANLAPSAQRPTPLDPPAADRLREIAAPTLVLAGALDDDSVLAITERLAAAIAGVEKRVLPNTAHLLPMEAPQRFADLVAAFVARSEPG